MLRKAIIITKPDGTDLQSVQLKINPEEQRILCHPYAVYDFRIY